MKVAVYYNGDSMRELFLAQAFIDGFTNLGDEVVKIDIEHYVEPEPSVQMAVVLGLERGKIFRDYQRAGRHVLLVTQGYIVPDRYYRFALDAFHSSWSNPDQSRAERLIQESGWKFMPARIGLQNFNTACYVGISKPYASWLGLEPIRTFDMSCCTRVLKTLPLSYKALFWCSKEPVPDTVRLPRRLQPMYRVHVQTVIENSCCVLSHGQPELVIPLLNGTPCIDMASEDLRPIPGLPSDEFKVASTKILSTEDRWKALADVASREFNIEEIRSGEALQTLIPHTVKRLEGLNLDPNSREYLVEQYKLMHENPRMFRGGLSDDVLTEMFRLSSIFSPKTLLDYGSGKGRQYDAKHAQHKAWGGPPPVCYDPGYPPHAIKPVHQFDGVLCTDVAEHIPEEQVPAFLEDVLWYGAHFALFRIATQPAVKTIPDGRNAHLTVQPADWWVDQILKALDSLNTRAVKENETVVVKKYTDKKWIIHYGRKSIVALFE